MRRLTPDLCVIGAGSGGLSVAAGAVQLGASVVLIERGRMGGDCLNVGCVPSKAMLAAAKAAHGVGAAARFGVFAEPPRIDGAAVYDHIRGVIAAIAPNDSVERFEGLGVTVLREEARFTDPNTVRAGDAEITPRRFVIATGSSPAAPPIPGLDAIPYMTNETVFDRTALPERLVVIGGGPIGVELAQAHRRLGCAVALLERFAILPKDDPELAAVVRAALVADGIELREQAVITRAERRDGGVALHLEGGDVVTGSDLLVAAGRRPTLEALDLDRGGIAYDAKGVTVDARLRSRTNRKVYAVGDAAGGPQFTHLAGHHAGIVIRNALFRLGALGMPAALPWVTYTEPELAQVGLTEALAREAEQEFRVLRWSFTENDRAQTERDSEGLVKAVVTPAGRILGAGIVGAQAGELIQLWTLAIARRLKIGALASTVLPYPTRGEASKRAAGAFYAPKLFSARTRRIVRLLARLG